MIIGTKKECYMNREVRKAIQGVIDWTKNSGDGFNSVAEVGGPVIMAEAAGSSGKDLFERNNGMLMAFLLLVDGKTKNPMYLYCV